MAGSLCSKIRTEGCLFCLFGYRGTEAGEVIRVLTIRDGNLAPVSSAILQLL
jgi:hypothetical protein